MTQLPAHLLRDPALQAVFDAIESGGHHAWLVGGAVRNALLDMPVEDLDLATDARPETIMRLAKAAGLKPVPTGIDHGTVTVIADGRAFEVTTLRRDIETDGRRAVVAFSDDLAQDARRRDFTMNALYANRNGTVIDHVGGLADLRARRLRFVGDPAQRIAEDYLRILRFFRFLAGYGRDADPAAVAACRDLRDGLDGISRERIGQELRKLLMARDPVPALILMRDTGVLDKVLPGATLDRLVSLERLAGRPTWLARLAALSQADLADALRLSRPEARDHRLLVAAMERGWSFNRIAHALRGDLAEAAALLVQTGPLGARDGWADARAAARPLPIGAADLHPRLHGPALGRALKAAEDAWIESGFALPPPALIDIAILAGDAR
ncbi:CCA tRNA nucleotidyltransferase [Paracoccus sediminis]|uniref:CCA tRNA nucleotidyltransferase n=1 Tax=Paracoccus sediminis TaxID=1214787 RepID=A0A238VX03_9RHOB|nr:CCA tRNA nucleotidyltransferase [Paracoccus sediminis]TBN51364.1 CCA tRNA nucleotidyltransferase [Paracoccus sediminis]SNR38664.1 poly(A) polymerase [Paracoccus sediminis]